MVQPGHSAPRTGRSTDRRVVAKREGKGLVAKNGIRCPTERVPVVWPLPWSSVLKDE